MHASFSKRLLSWYQMHRRKLPWRETRDPYAIFVSELMLQQTQVKTVIPYYERWMKRFPNAKKLAEASEEEVLKLWEGLGYYRRARFLHQAAKLIFQKYNGKFPKNPEDISNLPGVGRYTLGAVGSIAFDLKLPIVDGNVVRVLSRWFGIRTPFPKSRDQIWSLAEEVLPDRETGDFNQALMELGATVCLTAKPDCSHCPIKKGCWAFAKGCQMDLPNLPQRPKTIHQSEFAGFVVQKGKVLLSQRQKGGRMEGLWQFPSVTLSSSKKNGSSIWKTTFGTFRKAAELRRLRYHITHYRIDLQLHQILGLSLKKNSETRWVDLPQATDLPFTSAHRKLADQFLQ
jgi:A/G-specific adenine glycosylase